jgi:hypothetical protein
MQTEVVAECLFSIVYIPDFLSNLTRIFRLENNINTNTKLNIHDKKERQGLINLNNLLFTPEPRALPYVCPPLPQSGPSAGSLHKH